MSARETMNRYIETLVQRGDYASLFTEDVRFSVEGTDQSGTGRGAAEQTIRFMHEQAFDASPELKNLIVEDKKAAIEFDFVGVHIGDFAGVPATGRTVRVPYSVVYDLEGDAIKALRIYLPMQSLIEQLGTMPADAAGLWPRIRRRPPPPPLRGPRTRVWHELRGRRRAPLGVSALETV